MRKLGFILLSIILLVYGYQGYEIIYKYMQDDVKVKASGRGCPILQVKSHLFRWKCPTAVLSGK